MSSAKPKILFILTSHNKLGDTGKSTGWYLPEFAHPYHVLSPHAEIVVASPKGGEAPVDPSSVEAFAEDEQAQSFYREKKDLWTKTHKLDEFLGRANEFAAIFVVGGHGPMWDLRHNETSQKLISEFAEAGKIVSAVCHGSAALVNVKLANGESLVHGQSVTGFSDDEESAAQLTHAVPYLLESELAKSGAKYEKAPELWAAKVAVARNGKLITGQNPASATPLAEEILKVIKA
ncbi:putative chaperone protein HSP31 [Kalaharituber pfeilii]|nr:putative chaperone protein HSP31 [Kalaharituber pfeilii]